MKSTFEPRECAFCPEYLKLCKNIQRGNIMGSSNITVAFLKMIKTTCNEHASSTVKRSEEFLKKLISGCFSRVLECQSSNIALIHAIGYIKNRLAKGYEERLDVKDLKQLLTEAIEEYTRQIEGAIEKIGDVGAKVLVDGDVIITHGCSISVLDILGKAHRSGKDIAVIIAEGRPEFHGRLLAMATSDLGISTNLIIDSAVGIYMKEVSKVLLGAVAVSMRGDVLGKTGTFMVALAAHEAQVPVYVAASTYKFSAEHLLTFTEQMEEISFNEGRSSLVLNPKHISGMGIKVSNPIYDITPSEYIHQIITEKGIIYPKESLRIVKEIYGAL